MNAPCKDCAERSPGCHSVCDRYMLYDTFNKARREHHISEMRTSDPSPGKAARLRKSEINKMRGRHENNRRYY